VDETAGARQHPIRTLASAANVDIQLRTVGPEFVEKEQRHRPLLLFARRVSHKPPPSSLKRF
jgi:hypothetical protein